MLIKGITQLNQIITEVEKHELIHLVRATQLHSEAHDPHYGNSKGVQLNPNKIYDRLTEEVKKVTGLDIEKANAYARIYSTGSKLAAHTDREGLDLTLSIQLKNDFENTPIFAEGYDGTIYKSDLNDGDGVLLKGRELKHWRHDIIGGQNDELICIFFHWTIKGLEYLEIDDFLTESECNEIINSNTHMSESMVLKGDKAVVDENIRSNKVGWYGSDYIDNKIKELTGNLKLEGLQLLKYDKGNKFTPHFDYMYESMGSFRRLFTAIIYLNHNYAGGETNFPNIGLKIVPKRGKLVLWKNIIKDSNGVWSLNQSSLHESLPILKGKKHNLVQWLLVPLV